jgi:secreted trypsin-like serine protease
MLPGRFKTIFRIASVTAMVVALQAVPSQAFAIENGEPSDQATSQFVARLVVNRGFMNGTGYCTGSLVAPRLVLTAAHCVSSLRPSDWRVTFGYGTDEKQTFHVARVYKFADTAGAGKRRSVDDLAMVELADPVTTRQPIKLDSGTGTVDAAIGVWVVELGYGKYKEDTRQVPLPGAPKSQHLVDTIKRGGQLFLGALPEFAKDYGARPDPPGLLVAADPGYDKAGSVTSGRCMEGDSGGPLTLDTSAGPVLLGVLSLTDTEADERGRWTCTYTRVDNGDPYRTWVDSMIAEHGTA